MGCRRQQDDDPQEPWRLGGPDYSLEAHQQRPRTSQPRKLSQRIKRHLIRYTTKNKYQRRKTWWIITQELKIKASVTTINNIFYRNRYRRRPLKNKPLLTLEQKVERLNFIIKQLEELESKEYIVVYYNKTAVRIREIRG